MLTLFQRLKLAAQERRLALRFKTCIVLDRRRRIGPGDSRNRDHSKLCHSRTYRDNNPCSISPRSRSARRDTRRCSAPHSRCHPRTSCLCNWARTRNRRSGRLGSTNIWRHTCHQSCRRSGTDCYHRDSSQQTYRSRSYSQSSYSRSKMGPHCHIDGTIPGHAQRH